MSLQSFKVVFDAFRRVGSMNRCMPDMHMKCSAFTKLQSPCLSSPINRLIGSHMAKSLGDITVDLFSGKYKVCPVCMLVT